MKKYTLLLLLLSILLISSCSDTNKQQENNKNNTVNKTKTLTPLDMTVNTESPRAKKALESLSVEENKLVEELKTAQDKKDMNKTKEIKNKFRELASIEAKKLAEARKSGNKDLEKKSKTRLKDLSVFSR